MPWQSKVYEAALVVVVFAVADVSNKTWSAITVFLSHSERERESCPRY